MPTRGAGALVKKLRGGLGRLLGFPPLQCSGIPPGFVLKVTLSRAGRLCWVLAKSATGRASALKPSEVMG